MALTRHSVSELPVKLPLTSLPPSLPSPHPPVITNLTYVSPNPLAIHEYFCPRDRHFLRKDLCKCSFRGSVCLHNCTALFLLPVKSIPCLWVTLQMRSSLWTIRRVMGTGAGLKWQSRNSKRRCSSESGALPSPSKGCWSARIHQSTFLAF